MTCSAFWLPYTYVNFARVDRPGGSPSDRSPRSGYSSPPRSHRRNSGSDPFGDQEEGPWVKHLLQAELESYQMSGHSPQPETASPSLLDKVLGCQSVGDLRNAGDSARRLFPGGGGDGPDKPPPPPPPLPPSCVAGDEPEDTTLPKAPPRAPRPVPGVAPGKPVPARVLETFSGRDGPRDREAPCGTVITRDGDPLAAPRA